MTHPVRGLTGTITRIAGGDFTVDVPEGGKGEIGDMNECMRRYVDRMRGSLRELSGVAETLRRQA